MDNVKKFYETIKNDKTMAEEFKKQCDAANPTTEESAAELVVKFAAGKGFSFTLADLKALEAETRSLDQNELDKINAAGGAENRPTCSILFFHAENGVEGRPRCSFLSFS